MSDSFGARLSKVSLAQSSGKGSVIGDGFPLAGSTSTPYVKTPSAVMSLNDSDGKMDNSFKPPAGPMGGEGQGSSAGDLALELLNNTSNLTYSDTTDSGGFNFNLLFECDNLNDTLCQNVTSVPEAEAYPEHAYWSLFLLLFPLFTVFGNILVVMSIYRERSLRHVTNYFIASLAIADIFVAVIVMPPAVYMEVTKYWSLSEPLCDAWVAFDVMACTASILNLTAISVDRFIAVTQPIKYAKHKNSKRVHVMLALVWVVSIAIAAPIALGVNYSTLRQPGDCSFFNSDFLIYSSMGSFYIPSLIMIFLYWRIYRVLRQRAQKSQAKKKARSIDTQTLTNVIENTATTQTTKCQPTVKTGLANVDNGKITNYKTHDHDETSNHPDEASTSNPNTNTDSQDKDDESDVNVDVDGKSQSQTKKKGELIINPVARDLERRETGGKGAPPVVVETIDDVEETNFTKITPPTQDESSGSKQTKEDGKDRRKKEKKGVTKFNFHMRTSRKRKERSSSRRERKATKTLAIVLGVFLLCWWPFFTVNIMRAICIRYEVLNYPRCDIDGNLMGFFVWLGYINSFLNPVIYTIFNPEFRKAFKKILTEPCGRRY